MRSNRGHLKVKVLPGKLCFKGKIFPNMSQNSFIMHHRHMRIPCSWVNAFSITIKLSVKHQLSIVYTFHRLNISWVSGWPSLNSPVVFQGLSLDYCNKIENRENVRPIQTERSADLCSNHSPFPLVVACAFINIIRRKRQGIITVMSIPKAFKLVTLAIIIANAISHVFFWALAFIFVLSSCTIGCKMFLCKISKYSNYNNLWKRIRVKRTSVYRLT